MLFKLLFKKMACPLRLTQVCSRCVSSAMRRGTRLALASSSNTTILQQKRHNTQIVARKYPLPVGKDGGLPDRTQLNELHKILLEVEVVQYPDEMKCILTDFVEGVGIRGDVVMVKRDMFHDELYPAGLAVYASPENLEEFEEERKAKGIDKSELRLGVFARMTMKDLSYLNLEIPMSERLDWTLNAQHVAIAFRTQGVELEESCIVLPEEPVTDFQELTVDVWINGLESVQVKAKTVPITEKYPQLKKR